MRASRRWKDDITMILKRNRLRICETISTEIISYNGQLLNTMISLFLLIYFQRDATLHNLFISGKLLYMFRVVSPPIIRSTHNCIYSIWYLPKRYRYLPLLWKSWSWFECGVGIVLICFGAVASARNKFAIYNDGLVPTLM